MRTDERAVMAEAEKADFAEVPDRCPFCGSEGTTLMDLTDGTGMAWVKCISCRAEGPKRETGVEAVDAWNGTAGLVTGMLAQAMGIKPGYAPNAPEREGCRPAEPADMESVRRQFDEMEAKLDPKEDAHG